MLPRAGLLIISIAYAVAAQRTGLRITVDPRMELLAAVQSQTNYPVLTPLIFPYRQAMARHFSRHKDHPAVKMFAEMWPKGYNYDGPVSTMVCLSAPPELRLEAAAAECGANRAGGEERLLAFLEQLRDFARESDFTSFFEAQAPTYAKMVEQTRAKVTADYTGALYRYVGSFGHAPQFILAPMFMGNYGLRRTRSDGKLAIYNVMGAAGVRDGIPDFASPERLRDLAWHEFGHSFVNPAMDAHSKELEKYADLMAPVAARMRRQAYGDWMTVVRESVLRAVTCRLTYLEIGREQGDAALLGERRRGFLYVQALASRLEEYEANRRSFPTIASFAPRLVDVFRTIHKNRPGPDFFVSPFDGSISSAMDADEFVLIVPTREPDELAQRQLVQYVTMRRNQSWRDAKILTDEEALKTDLSGKGVLAYGTLKGNLWLARHAAGLPIRVEPGRVVADREYADGKLRLIAAWQHPQNPRRGIVVYTAATAEDILGIGARFQDDPSFIVLRGTEVIGQGNYVSRSGKWVLR